MLTQLRYSDLGHMARLALSRAMVVSATMVCLIAVPCAAHAHDDDAPATPQTFWTGWALFASVTILIALMAFKARVPTEQRIKLLRRRRKLRHKRPQGPG